MHVCDLGVVAYTVRRIATAVADAVADRRLLVTCRADVTEVRNFELIVEDTVTFSSPSYQNSWSTFVTGFATLMSDRYRASDYVEAWSISIDRLDTLARWRNLAVNVKEYLKRGGKPYRGKRSKWPTTARAA